MIRQRVGPVAPNAPEDFLSANGVAGELGVGRVTLRNIVENMGEELGEVNSYNFGTNTVAGYSPEQIEMIRQQLKSKNK
jgi:CO dehydrogenase/acetyl-CoA synthase alpha subunit